MIETDDTNHDYLWPPNTILIASDSMLQNIDENRLCKGKFKVKFEFSGELYRACTIIIPSFSKKKNSARDTSCIS